MFIKAYTASSVINGIMANKNLSTRSEHLGCSLKSKHPRKLIDIRECYRGDTRRCEEN